MTEDSTHRTYEELGINSEQVVKAIEKAHRVNSTDDAEAGNYAADIFNVAEENDWNNPDFIAQALVMAASNMLMLHPDCLAKMMADLAIVLDTALKVQAKIEASK